MGRHRQGGAWTLKGPYCKEIGCPLCCSSSESTLRRRERDHRYGYIYPERRTLLTSSFLSLFFTSLCVLDPVFSFAPDARRANAADTDATDSDSDPA